MDVYGPLVRSSFPINPIYPINPTMGTGKQKDALYGDDQYYEEAVILFYGQVVGPPSKTHWKADSEAKKCTMTYCNRVFNLFERRHHCRRVCNKCYDDYVRLRYRHPEPFVLRFLKDQEEESREYHQDSGYNTMSDSYGTDKSSNNSNTKYPNSDDEVLKENSRDIQYQQPIGYNHHIVPENWAWSTF
ncbi:FYVE-type zinc finger-containing protein C9B6.03 [Gigaspora margarita]|uniref:FYVE-type zinc finger-containing protein C9B6.03 n=1 Tax=Gigaspora margarita TaxID=4874 RepID=A0A8H3X5U3_GIGMA|nr:FYVE-type zinc finger-containing protein C9B6.03 [Gigaspora margarita]